MRLDLFVKLKNKSSTIILFVGITYSMCDLLCDLNNYVWPANYRYAPNTVNDVALPLTSARLNKLRILCINHILDGDLCQHIFYFHIFSFFLALKHDFIRYVDFTHIAVSNTASDDVTNHVTHRIFNKDLLYSGAYFVVEMDKKI